MSWYLGSMHVPGLAWIVEECLLAGQLESLKLLQLWASKLGVKRRFSDRAWDLDLGLSRGDPLSRKVGTWL